MTNPLAFFAPSGKRGRFPEGTSVLEAARKLGVDLDSVCGGRGICGRCQVEIGEGKFPKLGIVSALDERHRLERGRGSAMRRSAGRSPTGRRLGCQAQALRRRRRRRAGRQPGPPPGRAQERRGARHRHRSAS